MSIKMLKTKGPRTPEARKKPGLIRLGTNVAERRRTLGIEQNDFAKRIGVNGETFREFELGYASLDSEKIKKIAEELGCTTLQLFGMV